MTPLDMRQLIEAHEPGAMTNRVIITLNDNMLEDYKRIARGNLEKNFASDWTFDELAIIEAVREQFPDDMKIPETTHDKALRWLREHPDVPDFVRNELGKT